MYLSGTFACLLMIFAHALGAETGLTSPLGAVTDHVFTLRTAPRSHHLIAPSSKHLARRRHRFIARQSTIGEEPIASIHQELTTIGGRVYMTSVSIAERPFTLVIDTGSSDTWVASSKFRCLSPDSAVTVPQSYCGFNSLFNEDKSPTYELIPSHNFSVRYTDGEYLSGNLARDNIAFGEDNQIKIRQTLGVVEEGYWMGDGISSGLLGMAYPSLVSGAKDLNYSSVVFTLFQNTGIPPMFSLALTSPTSEDPSIGGVLAIGGIPNVTHDWDFVGVPIHPVVSSSFTFYSIPVDGFSVTPPTRGRVKGKLLPTPLSPARKRMDFSKNSLDMIIDSGSTLLYFPDHLCDYIASLFNPPAVFNASSNLYIVPCSAAAPRVGIIIGGKTFHMRESDLMNKAPGAVGGASLGIKEGDCVCAFQRQGQDDAVLGDSWLRSVLVLIDLEAAEVRVAARI